MSTPKQRLPWPAEEKAEIFRHLRAWADDGKPVVHVQHALRRAR